MEEDAGKSVHGDKRSFIDLNRAGTPLLEIVTDPVLSSPSEASEYLKKIRLIAQYLEISDGNLEEGSFRCDANVSLKRIGSDQLGTRVEIKNLNSYRNIEKAITYEIFRQKDLLDNGEKIVQETVLYDPSSGKTQSMRGKEDSHDYRYFPDPDLKPLILTEDRIENIISKMPELPEARKMRFISDYKIASDDAVALTNDKALADFFEESIGLADKVVLPKTIANWVLSDYLKEVHKHHLPIINTRITSKTFSELLNLISNDTISGKIAKTVIEVMAETGDSPKAIVEAKGLVQIIDKSAIAEAIDKVLDENPNQLEQYLSGKEKLLGFFVGQVMKLSKGKFNPGLVNETLKVHINERSKK